MTMLMDFSFYLRKSTFLFSRTSSETRCFLAFSTSTTVPSRASAVANFRDSPLALALAFGLAWSAAYFLVFFGFSKGAVSPT